MPASPIAHRTWQASAATASAWSLAGDAFYRNGLMSSTSSTKSSLKKKACNWRAVSNDKTQDGLSFAKQRRIGQAIGTMLEAAVGSRAARAKQKLAEDAEDFSFASSLFHLEYSVACGAGISTAEVGQRLVLIVSVTKCSSSCNASSMRKQHWQIGLLEQSFSPKMDNVRSVAGVLGVRYRQLADGEFNHTSALVLLDADGPSLHAPKISAACSNPNSLPPCIARREAMSGPLHGDLCRP